VTKDDREHFEEYTLQNRIKHRILEDYFRAYMRALGNQAAAFHYIDGFAGAGTYEGMHAGSPLIALTLLADQRQPWTVSFVEADSPLFDQLSVAIGKASQHTTLAAAPPFLKLGEFSQYVQEILNREIYAQYRAVATFAFIDPCGVRGVRMADIAEIMSKPFGECLLFWNYDGINRWLGAVAAGTLKFEGLLELFGNETVAAEALEIFSADAPEKERALRDLFFESVRAYSKAQFLLPFRFEAKGSSRTSHYLVHCCNDGLPFKIMKHVMGKAASSDQGFFELLNDADTSFQMGMFRPHIDKARLEILQKLQHSKVPVRLFTENWVRRPTDLMTSDGYRILLLDMEQLGEIKVLDKDGVTPKPVEKRRRRLDKPTLGENYVISMAR
jgi:three-Cys-motif partner protein